MINGKLSKWIFFFFERYEGLVSTKDFMFKKKQNKKTFASTQNAIDKFTERWPKVMEK